MELLILRVWPLKPTKTVKYERSWYLQEGGSVADALAAGLRFSLRRALEIGIDCVRGLNYLHLENPNVIIHRDLKPSNLMFKGSPHCTQAELALDTGVAKLTDFGLSKSLLQVRPLSQCLADFCCSWPPLELRNLLTLHCTACTLSLKQQRTCSLCRHELPAAVPV
jgi:serine/threonine protein kinase